jgi:hypothetical protein
MIYFVTLKFSMFIPHPFSLSSSTGATTLGGFWPAFLKPSQQFRFIQGAFASCTPNPLLRRTGVSLLVLVITFDLSGKGDPANSYATAGIALGII